MLQQGIIIPSESAWSSPVVLVPKKGHGNSLDPKDWRFCIDYMKLNDVAIADQYALLRCDEVLEYFGNSKYYTTLDLIAGYH